MKSKKRIALCLAMFLLAFFPIQSTFADGAIFDDYGVERCDVTLHWTEITVIRDCVTHQLKREYVSDYKELPKTYYRNVCVNGWGWCMSSDDPCHDEFTEYRKEGQCE